METRLAMVLAGGLDGVSVTALCAELEISRQTYYRLRRRYQADGPAGLAPRSRRPHSCPGAVDPALELEIIRLRTDEGWPDPPRGAASIADELRRSGLASPAVSTIHRVLVRNGLVTPQPQKRPRASYTQFVYPDPNDCWQIDATRWELADDTEAWIMDVLDDRPRVVVAAHACPAPTNVLHSGSTVIQHVYDTHFAGVAEVERVVAAWQDADGLLPADVVARVRERLAEQLRCAREWRDQVNTYFFRKPGVPDARGRPIY